MARRGAIALHGAKLRNLIAKAPKHTHEAVREDYHRIAYALNLEAAQKAREQFLGKWRKLCPAVATSQEEAGEELLTFYQFLESQHLSLRTTSAIERMQLEFRRRVKTQAALPSEDAVLRLFFGVVDQRTDQAAPHQGLSRHRRPRKSCLKEKISMTSQGKCAIHFSTGFGTQPAHNERPHLLYRP